MKTLHHSLSLATVVGFELVAGAVLLPDDLYESTSGSWELNPSPGLTLGSTPARWARVGELSPDAVGLLNELAGKPKGCFDCISQRSDGRYVFVPSVRYNGDTRIATPPVSHPKCIQALLDVGFLSKDPGQAQPIGVEFYTLTDLGRTAAKQS